jgi:hypothetical protein
VVVVTFQGGEASLVATSKEVAAACWVGGDAARNDISAWHSAERKAAGARQGATALGSRAQGRSRAGTGSGIPPAVAVAASGLELSLCAGGGVAATLAAARV